MEEFSDTPQSWMESEIFYLDFEGSRRSGIAEYGFVIIQGGEIVDVKTRLCKPEREIPYLETATHQIRNEDVQNMEGVQEDWNLFRDLRARGPFSAHHASVENGLIKGVWPFTSQSPNFISGEMDVDWGPWLDTCALYRNLFPGMESYSLGILVEKFGLSDELEEMGKHWCPSKRCFFHCAAFDAIAGALLLLNLKQYEEVRELSLSELLMWSQSGGAPEQDEQMEFL